MSLAAGKDRFQFDSREGREVGQVLLSTCRSGHVAAFSFLGQLDWSFYRMGRDLAS